MLVSRKQEWDVQEEQTPSVSAQTKPAINKDLRNKCLVVVAILAAMAMAVTVQSEMIVRSGYGLVQLKAQATSLEKENEQLRLDIAKLKSPQRIQEIAISQLGMVAPQTILYANHTAKPTITQTGQEKSLIAQVVAALKEGIAEASKGR